MWYTRYEHKEVLHLKKAPGYKQNVDAPISSA